MTELDDASLVTMRWVRENYVLKDATARDMTTQELAAELGHSADWWRTKAPGISGAYQDSPKSPWYIPRQAAAAFLDSYKAQKASRGGTAAISPGPLVGRRPPALGRRKAYSYKS